MFSFLKKFIRVGVITLLLVVGAGAVAVAVVGPGRAHAVLSSAQDHVQQAIDGAITDPSALRQQLREMEREYPERISQVRGDLAQLNEEMRQIERERAICYRVVELAQMDLNAVQGELSSGAVPAENRLSAGGARVAPVNRLAVRARQIENTRMVYANRAEDAAVELSYMHQQAGRLEELLAKLETEHAQFKGQLLALSRQVDAIARNERLIELVEKHNRSFQECSRYEAVSLDQITARLHEIRTRQESELDVLAQAQEVGDYENVARQQLAAEAFAERVGAGEGKPLVPSEQ
ncbi:MAG: hypothetical protein AB1726_01145 [Planctomycetota bacterium]